MSKQHTPTAPIIHWSDDIRLKMIDKSNFYPGDERVYQYGYFDGFHEAIKSHEVKINNHDRLVEALTSLSETVAWLADNNGDDATKWDDAFKEVADVKQLLTELK